ncbi:Hypothetical predicted protein [Pelobates cultripes]|uniref:Uncharacterized protein n=1 Tax=Pelobates cultripes TaxID=61616 RepID=A0AAD1SWS4_PELCU|nr:Hypothetical predicted protein [Pelobates cultripes]
MATTDPDPQEFQSLLDTTMSKSISKAISSAMGAMSSTISDSITQALKQVQPHPTPALTHTPPEGRLPGRKALTKRRHSQDPPPMQVDPALIDMPQAVHDGAQQPRNRASGRATATRDWKRAKAHDVLSDSDEEGDEGSDAPYSDPVKASRESSSP